MVRSFGIRMDRGWHSCSFMILCERYHFADHIFWIPIVHKFFNHNWFSLSPACLCRVMPTRDHMPIVRITLIH